MRLKGLSKKQIRHYLGVQPIAEIDDNMIWKYLVTKNAASLLGDVINPSPKEEMVETVEGEFPGDEVSNLNQHRIYGETNFIRFPYLKTTYATEFGKLIIKRDQTKFVVLGWFGQGSRAQLIYKVAFRDRCFDGTPYANDCSLQDFPRHDPVLHKRLPVGDALCCELSTYGFLPNTRIKDLFGDTEFDAFIGKPFSFIDRPEVFLKHFERAFRSALAPGQVAVAIPDMARFMGPNVDIIAKEAKYEFAEGAASHYHVYRWGQAFGWRVSDPEKAAILDQLTAGLAALKKKGIKLTRSQESWVCVLQSLPRKYIPDELYLGGATWQHDGLNKNYLWMHKPLSDNAKKLIL